MERAVFPGLLSNGKALYGYASNAYWMDIGTPHRYLRGTWDILEGKVEQVSEANRELEAFSYSVAHASSGEVHKVLDESTPTFFESGNGRVNWRYLPATNEMIWFSEQDNWGQLYLHDGDTGKLKNKITSGEGNVTQLLREARSLDRDACAFDRALLLHGSRICDRAG